VHRGAAQQRQVLGVRDLSGEMHAREVGLALDLAQQVLAVGLARRQARRIAHLVAADDDDTSVRPALLDLGDRAHEDVKATVGLQIASHIRHHFLI